MTEKQLHNFDPIFGSCLVQGRPSRVVSNIDILPSFQTVGDQVKPALLRGPMQRSLPTAAADLDTRHRGGNLTKYWKILDTERENNHSLNKRWINFFKTKGAE